ncbi:MAG: hypothetical protein HC915_16060 [Anaerolineae bacterium]|nr:hypothetical protein [Anaerolineae bacterium]
MQLRRNFLRTLEAGLMGFILVQSVRYLFATLYAHLSSADLVSRVGLASVRGMPGVVDPTEVQREVVAVAATLAAPLLGLGLARTRWSISLAVGLCVLARALALQVDVYESVLAEAVAVAAALLYMTVIMVRRPRVFPLMVTLGFAGDIVLRALNATADPTFDPGYTFVLLGRLEADIETAWLVGAGGMLLLTAVSTLVEREEARLPGFVSAAPRVLSGWGGLALGAFCFWSSACWGCRTPPRVGLNSTTT